MELKNKFAIGCLVQWYEIDMIGEYLHSVKNALDVIDNRENVIVDLYLNCNESLESVDETQITISDIKEKFKSLLEEVFDYDVEATVGRPSM